MCCMSCVYVPESSNVTSSNPHNNPLRCDTVIGILSSLWKELRLRVIK